MLNYVISIPTPHRRLVQVTMTFDVEAAGPVDVVFPVWTPGSYLVREHERHVNDFAAWSGDGARLPARKVEKHRYRVDAAQAGEVRLTWEVYAHELTVRTNHVDASHAFLNPVAMLPYVDGRDSEPHRMQVQDLPSDWGVACALDVEDGWFVAKDYDELADSPLECGPHARVEERLRFDAAGVPHEIVIWGRCPDRERVQRDVIRIVEAQAELFGGLPYDRYLIILLIAQGRGGLEHRASTALLVERDDLTTASGYEDFLSLVSHELFHVWNVKRIKPAAFTPYDLTRENYTRLLWAFEGFTSYYQDLFLVRAGLVSPARWLEILGERLTALARTEGRKRQSVADSSFDAWIRLYRPDEETANSTVSYYLKGALVSLVIDLELRRLSNGARSLDDVLRLLWERHGRTGVGVEEDGVEDIIEEVAGTSMRPLLDHILYSTGELPTDEVLASHGLIVDRRAATGQDDRGGRPAKNVLRCFIGARLKVEGERVIVASVRRGSPADLGGLTPGDHIVAIDGLRALPKGAFRKLHAREPGTAVELALFRRDELMTLTLTAAKPVADTCVVREDADASGEKRRLFKTWVGLED